MTLFHSRFSENLHVSREASSHLVLILANEVVLRDKVGLVLEVVPQDRLVRGALDRLPAEVKVVVGAHPVAGVDRGLVDGVGAAVVDDELAGDVVLLAGEDGGVEVGEGGGEGVVARGDHAPEAVRGLQPCKHTPKIKQVLYHALCCTLSTIT